MLLLSQWGIGGGDVVTPLVMYSTTSSSYGQWSRWTHTRLDSTLPSLLWLDIRGVIITVLRRRAYFVNLWILGLSIWHSHKEAKNQTSSDKMRFVILWSNPHKAQREVCFPTHRTIVDSSQGDEYIQTPRAHFPFVLSAFAVEPFFFVWRWALFFCLCEAFCFAPIFYKGGVAL